MQFNESEFPF